MDNIGLKELISLFGGGIGAVAAVCIWIVYREASKLTARIEASHDKVAASMDRVTAAMVALVVSDNKEAARIIAEGLKNDITHR